MQHLHTAQPARQQKMAQALGSLPLGDLDGDACCQLWPVSDLTVASIWGTDPADGRPLFAFLSLFLCLSKKTNKSVVK